jgi:sodium-dependent dicarboxylate transporter 2/3/5
VVAFGVTVSLWVLPGVVAVFAGPTSPVTLALKWLLPEAVVAVIGAGILFLLPVDWKKRQFTLTWNQAARIDWGTLMLFGCGLSLGSAMGRTGLAEVIGKTLVAGIDTHSVFLLAYLFSVIAILLTETTSNTAGATIIAPLAIEAAQAAGVSPIPVAVSVALCCSMAFMLPVSTPPNAIVYGSGCVPITKMIRHGAFMNVASISIAPALVVLLCKLLGLA